MNPDVMTTACWSISCIARSCANSVTGGMKLITASNRLPPLLAANESRPLSRPKVEDSLRRLNRFVSEGDRGESVGVERGDRANESRDVRLVFPAAEVGSVPDELVRGGVRRPSDSEDWLREIDRPLRYLVTMAEACAMRSGRGWGFGLELVLGFRWKGWRTGYIWP